MADLFGEDSGSEGEAVESSKPPEIAVTNGHGEEVKGAGAAQNGLEESNEEEADGPNSASDLPPRYGGSEYEEETRGPRDEISVSVTQFQKTADDFTFDVEVEVNGKKSTLHRTYKELLWLHRNLTRRVELGGNILPPMPAPPPKATDAKIAILGKDSRALYGDHTRLPCLGIETLLQALADHRFFSENNTVHTYLVKEQVEMEDRLGGGSIWSSFTKAISDFRKSGVQDPEEEFTKFLKNVEELAPRLQEAAKTFSAMITAQQNMAVSEFLLSEMLWEHSNWLLERNRDCSKVLHKLANGIHEEKEYLLATAYDAQHTLGFTFNLYHDYCIQAKEMLYRRLGKLQALLSCTATLDKAKPEKKAAAEAAKEEADRAFKAITETAKREIEVYTDQYAQAFKANLESYTQARIHHSKQSYETLSKLREELGAIQLE